MINAADLPPLALSVRQPWAWAIIHAGKDIENRGLTFERKRGYNGLKRRIAIHASSGMTRAEYQEGCDFMAQLGVKCPNPADLVRGAIIGAVTVVDVKRNHHSAWFFGPLGLVLAQAEALAEPIPCSGMLGYFGWKPSGGEVTPPAKWMMPKVVDRLPPADDACLFATGHLPEDF